MKFEKRLFSYMGYIIAVAIVFFITTFYAFIFLKEIKDIGFLEIILGPAIITMLLLLAIVMIDTDI